MNIMIIAPNVCRRKILRQTLIAFCYIVMSIILHVHVYILYSIMSITCTHFHHYSSCQLTFILCCVLIRYCYTFYTHCIHVRYSHKQRFRCHFHFRFQTPILLLIIEVNLCCLLLMLYYYYQMLICHYGY